MSLDALSFGFKSSLRCILQTEAAECGLACIAMISSFFGRGVDLRILRSRHTISLKGTTLTDLITIADSVQLSSRPLRLELDDLAKIRRPCILHWNLNHFVVLRDVKAGFIVIHDPASGVRRISMEEASARFTGVALELWPSSEFVRTTSTPKLKLRQLFGQVIGLSTSIGQIFLLAVALELFGLVSPFFMQWVVDDVIVSSDRDLLTTLILGFGLLLVVRVLIGIIRSWSLMHISTTLGLQWRTNIFRHLLRLPVQYFQKRHLGDVYSRFQSVDKIQDTLTSSFIEAVIDGLMSLATLAMMFIYSPMLGSIALTAVAIYALMRAVWYGSLRAKTASQIVFSAKQQSHFLESIRGIRTIKLFQREEQRRVTWVALLIDQINASLGTQRLQIIYNSFNSFLVGLENLIVIGIGARMVLEGNFTIGALMAFKLYDDQFKNRVTSLVDKAFQFTMLSLHGERLADIVLTEPEQEKGTAASVGEPTNTNVIVKNLKFRYGDNEPLVLDDVSFEIAAGESIALTGPSGCGKTTLVQVILGILKPESGHVSIGGVELNKAGTGALRHYIGTVLQDDVLFAGSIAENISFFDPDQSQARIEECSKLAAIHDEIVSMPMGYNSLVGDMGTVLSGGQKQRVLLARALYKRPKILLLDEATSHLDVENERQVSAAIKGLNITRLVVAHRPETVATANRVIVLRDGKIVSDGPRQHAPILASVPNQTSTGAPDSNNSLPAAPSFLRQPSVT